jgi:hypothetical protein
MTGGAEHVTKEPRARDSDRQRHAATSHVCAVCSAECACPASFRGKAPKFSSCRRATHDPRAGNEPQNGAAGSAPRHMTPCACHCAACRAAGGLHGNTCVFLRMGLLRLFHGKTDIVDLAALPRSERMGHGAL